jgi:hypothetical protein
MTRRHLHVVLPLTPASCITPGPVPVAVDIARLLRALPPPIDADPAVFRRWLAAKADLFDRIATAAADDNLAADARAVAAAARHTLASLAVPVPVDLPLPVSLPPVPAPDLGGDAA